MGRDPQEIKYKKYSLYMITGLRIFLVAFEGDSPTKLVIGFQNS